MSNNPKEEALDQPNARPQKSATREWVEAILIAFLLAMFIRTFFVQAFKIPSGSMQDTLLIGDHILVTKYSYGVHIPNEIIGTSIRLFPDYILFPETPKRFDVVVFKFPLNESKDFIKRVIGLPGETIMVRDQVVYIDGKKIVDPHAHHTMPPSAEPEWRDNFGPTLIPEGHIFVMGDNRENSQDSRFWLYLDIKKIRGKARMIYWSWNPDGQTMFLEGAPRMDRMFQTIN